MTHLDPAESPRAQGLLDVGDGQRVYWQEWGRRDGVPALYLHGGPGSGLGTSAYRGRFDLSRTRLVAFEQRGCGRSTPHASEPSTSLQHNDTPHLVADIETLRRHLGIDAWTVNGASWGCTLALAYAQEHPERVLGLVGYAVTTTSRREVDWITEGIGAIFPEAWHRFATHAETAGIGYRRGQGRLVEAYARLLGSDDPTVRDAASREWALWEDTHVSIATGHPAGPTVGQRPVPVGVHAAGRALLGSRRLQRPATPRAHGPPARRARHPRARAPRRLEPSRDRVAAAPGVARLAPARRRGLRPRWRLHGGALAPGQRRPAGSVGAVGHGRYRYCGRR